METDNGAYCSTSSAPPTTSVFSLAHFPAIHFLVCVSLSLAYGEGFWITFEPGRI